MRFLKSRFFSEKGTQYNLSVKYLGLVLIGLRHLFAEAHVMYHLKESVPLKKKVGLCAKNSKI